VRRLIRALLGNDGLDRRLVSGETSSARDRGYSLIRATGFGERPIAAQVALVHEMIAATSVDVRRRSFEGMIVTDLRRAAQAIDVPTLVVIGARDRLVNPHQSRQLARSLRDGHALTFRNAGHAVVLERASHIASRTLRLAEQVLAGSVDLAAVAAG
jgi:pimeloyl-ACP methyl ester carboxylesterase